MYIYICIYIYIYLLNKEKDIFLGIPCFQVFEAFSDPDLACSFVFLSPMVWNWQRKSTSFPCLKLQNCLVLKSWSPITAPWSSTSYKNLIWLVVSTPLKNIRQTGNLPQIGVKIKNIWNHHLVIASSKQTTPTQLRTSVFFQQKPL